MLDNKSTYKYLNDFAKYVIQQSRSNLTKGNKNVNKNLYNSLDKQIEVSANSFRLTFLMENYGEFQDKGVSGTKRKYDTPFSYSSKRPPLKPIEDWVTKRRFQFRNKESGKFMSFKSTAYLIAGGILKNGIKPSLFFTKPFEAGYKKYIDTDLMKAFGQDIDTMVDSNLTNIQ